MSRLPRSAAGLLAVAALWLTATAWIRPLALPDEGRYVGVAWEMLRSGDWLTPTLNGLPYFHKPPLFYWITAASLAVFGNVEWAARLAPWLGGCLMSAAVLLFGRRHLDNRQTSDWLLVLVLMPLAYVGAQYANHDMLVASLISCTILAFAHALLLPAGDKAARRWQLAACTFSALAVLSKGLIGIVLPGLVLLAWLPAAGRARDIGRLFWWPGLLLFLVLVSPWFLLMQQRFPEFAHYFFAVQHFGRFTQAEQTFNNLRPFWFYPVVLAVLGLPWSLWLLRRGPGAATDQARQVRLLMWIWLAAITGFFSLPKSKLVGYILPAVPPLAMLLSLRWRTALQAGGWQRRLAQASVLLALAVCLAPVMLAPRLAPDKDARRAAAVVAGSAHPVVFLRNYWFDLPFYARLPGPVTVLDDWEDPALTRADNWRRELWDAKDFAPAADRTRLMPVRLLQAANCPGAVTLVVGDKDAAERHPLLAGARAIPAGPESVWELRDWAPSCPGTPSASWPGK